MSVSYLKFRESLYAQGLFPISQVNIYFPDFNRDSLLNWQKKGYIVRLRRGWYCFTEFLTVPDSSFLIANAIYPPSYISHQEALLFYGLIPEHIVDSTSITTKKTAVYKVCGKVYKYYSIHPRLFFGYELKEMTVNNLKRNFMMATREKAMLDLLYIFDFYTTEADLEGIRFNESAIINDLDWNRMEDYLIKFKLKILEKKLQFIKNIYGI